MAGRKQHLITGIQLALSAQGKTIEEIKDITRRYHRAKISDLEPIFHALSEDRKAAIDNEKSNCTNCDADCSFAGKSKDIVVRNNCKYFE